MLFRGAHAAKRQADGDRGTRSPPATPQPRTAETHFPLPRSSAISGRYARSRRGGAGALQPSLSHGADISFRPPRAASVVGSRARALAFASRARPRNTATRRAGPAAIGLGHAGVEDESQLLNGRGERRPPGHLVPATAARTLNLNHHDFRSDGLVCATRKNRPIRSDASR